MRQSEKVYAAMESCAGAYRPMVPHRPARDVICLGKTFRAHAEEFAAYAAEAEAVPKHPVVFIKAPQALCGATNEIVISRQAIPRGGLHRAQRCDRDLCSRSPEGGWESFHDFTHTRAVTVLIAENDVDWYGLVPEERLN